MKICLIFLALFCLIQKSSSSHFRGASITWEPTHNGTEMKIHFRISWRRSFFSFFCDETTIDTGRLLNGDAMTCFDGCTGSPGSLDFYCTDFSDDDDWTSGRNTVIFDPMVTSVIHFGYSSGAWIELRRGGNNWMLRVTADLASRVDTGRINSAPTVDMAPVLYLQRNCSHYIQLPVSDKDGDVVRCRFATKDEDDECADICDSFTGEIDKDNCALTYTANEEEGYYVVAVQIEDFVDESSTTPLSSVPLQFLIYVFDSTANCASGPVFVSPTPEENSKHCFAIGSQKTFNITASSSSHSISDIETVSPLGLVRASQTAWSLNSTSFFSIVVSWMPTADDIGENTLCFTAKDNTRLSSETRCVFLSVSEPITIISKESSFTKDGFEWNIHCNTQVSKPSVSKYFSIYYDNGTLYSQIDSTSNKVTIHVTNITVQVELEDQTNSYYMLHETGVVIGTGDCPTQLDGVTDSTIFEMPVKDCGLPENPALNSQSFWTTTTFGSNVTYRCTGNCIVKTETVLECDWNGLWNGQPPSCDIVDCTPLPQRPINGDTSEVNTTCGSVVNFTCYEGYILTGKVALECLSDGNWNGTEPKCVPVDCRIPDIPVHSTYIGSETTFGSVITYSCNVGYDIIGDHVIECLSDGNWNGTGPECEPVDCGEPPEAPEYGSRAVTTTTYGSVVSYDCSEGFLFVGPVAIECTSDGSWNDTTLPYCQARDCGEPPEAPEYGSRTVTTTTYGSVVSYDCIEGFLLVGPVAIECTSDGSWNDTTLPDCQARDCGEPPEAPEYGSRTVTTTTYGSVVSYDCIEGFLLVGPVAIECMSDGSWNDTTLPDCQARDCGEPPEAPEYGSRTVTTTTYGSVVSYDCIEGFLLVGPVAIECTSDGSWNDTTLPDCKARDCGAPPEAPEYGSRAVTTTTYGSVVSYDCIEGFLLVGPVVIECTSDGSWNDTTLPDCQARDCGEPPEAPEYGSRAVTTTTYGSVVSYDCIEGFLLVGPVVIECTSDGSWNDTTLPDCQARDCGEPPEAPEYGSRAVTTTTYGSVVSYDCIEGFLLVGPVAIECTSDGSWNDTTVPDCRATAKLGDPCLHSSYCVTIGAYCLNNKCVCRTGVYEPLIDECDTMPLYSYGEEVGDVTLPSVDDQCGDRLTFSTGVPIFGVTQKNVYICPNGIISFNNSYVNPRPSDAIDSASFREQFILAPFYADVDLQTSGQVFSRNYSIDRNEEELHNSEVTEIENFIVKHGKVTEFQSIFVLIVTWNKVEPFFVDEESATIKGEATFQLVFTSDGIKTFVLFIYGSQRMKWQSSLRKPDVWIGYQAGQNYSVSNINSFKMDVLEIDQHVYLDGIKGVTLHTLYNPGDIPSPETVNGLKCLKWYNQNKPQLADIQHQISQQHQCPCNLRKLTYDPWFDPPVPELDHPEIVCTVIYPARRFEPYGESCCYNLTSGQWVNERPFAGSFHQYHPVTHSQKYKIYDRDAKYYCCYGSNNCKKYYELRPIGTCYSKSWFQFTTNWGDPHFQTLDGQNFTFNGLGEFVILTYNDTDSTFDLQARTEQAVNINGQPTNATVFTAFAARDGDNATFHVELNRNKTGFVIYGNQKDLSLTYENISDESYYFKERNLKVTRRGDTLIVLFPSVSIVLNVTLDIQMLSIKVSVPNTIGNKTRGLLGNLDGDITNDFITPDGNVKNVDMTDAELFDYGMTWEVEPEDSIFKYEIGKSHIDFINASFTPEFLDLNGADPVILQTATVLCKGTEHPECIFDLLATENEEIALQTLLTDETSQNDSIELKKTVPIVEGCEPQYVNLGETTLCQISVDSEETVEIRLIGEEDGVTYDATENAIQYKAEKIESVKIGVVAISESGVESPPFYMETIFCSGCSQHGECLFGVIREDSLETELSKFAQCQCWPEYDGPDCEHDLDGCVGDPCSLQRTCKDLPADQHELQNKAYVCSPCPSGYLEIGDKCIDIDECVEREDICQQACVNTDGSYYCMCNNGFRVDQQNPALCRDINECEEDIHKCQHDCINIQGGYECICNGGFKLNSTTNTSCFMEEDVCAGSNLDCDQTAGCTQNETGSPTCFCNVGYQLMETGLALHCKDIDECSQGTCYQGCVNTEGSFECTCLNGYQLMEDNTCKLCEFPFWGPNCGNVCECQEAVSCDPVYGCVCIEGWTGDQCTHDVDECMIDNICSDVRKQCINTLGSYDCVCIEGFELLGESCVDIDECWEELDDCDQTCTNVEGYYTCGCLTGYRQTSANMCEDIDECILEISGCDFYCENFPGLYNCYCPFGYSLNEDRRTCSEVADPCKSLGNLTCDHLCVKDLLTQTVSCSCKRGYTLSTDEVSCLDINECQNAELNQCGANAECINTEGNYVCVCPWGTKFDSDDRACTECDEFHYGERCEEECQCLFGVCNSNLGCVCDEGWTGRKCDLDKDECQSANQVCPGDHMTCRNILGGYRCECMEGFFEESGVCRDIDECGNNRTQVCDQKCVNIVGSYQCLCHQGFVNKDGICLDINECSVQHDCDQTCENTLGGYRCSCVEGYRLDKGNRKHCIATSLCNTTMTQYCDSKNGTCSVNSDREAVCSCKKGYIVQDSSESACIDIDECLKSPCLYNCTNTPGGFTCVCPPGYQLEEDQVTCKECDIGYYGMGCLKKCMCNITNTDTCDSEDGSCTCLEGWTGPFCETDINECADSSLYDCPLFSECRNTEGWYICKCDKGYQKTGLGSCEGCPRNWYGEDCAFECPCNVTNTEECKSVTGTCLCLQGWSGGDCSSDKDECERATSICNVKNNSQCRNVPGSYKCDCIDGYFQQNDACRDVNECGEIIDLCPQQCNNVDGSYTCSCFHGYRSDGMICQECDGNTFGLNCSSVCDCDTDHVVNVNQSCDPVSGSCDCVSGWMGDRCDNDINECDIDDVCDGEEHVECHNFDGGHLCDCVNGYIWNSEICIEDDTATNTEPILQDWEKSATLTNRLDVHLPEGTNLNVGSVQNQYRAYAQQTISDYYQETTVTVNSVRAGSLLLDYTLVFKATNQTHVLNIFHKVWDLVEGRSALFQDRNVFMSVVLPQDTETMCDLYQYISGPCGSQNECVILGTEPTCREKGPDETLNKIIWGSVGGVIVLVCAVLSVCFIKLMRERRNRKKKENHMLHRDMQASYMSEETGRSQREVYPNKTRWSTNFVNSMKPKAGRVWKRDHGLRFSFNGSEDNRKNFSSRASAKNS